MTATDRGASSTRPTLWIIAGPNGSGKSTLYQTTSFLERGGSVWIINPDLLTATIAEAERLPLNEANLASVRRIEHWLYASLDVYRTIGVETVLSTDKYRKLVIAAAERGFETRLIYVFLDTSERQLDRIRIRVREGGHDVPEDAVRRRRLRSFEQLAWFIEHATTCHIFDNSTGQPSLVAEAVAGRLSVTGPLAPDLAEVLRMARATRHG